MRVRAALVPFLVFGPIVLAQSQTEQALLTASDLAAGDGFGSTVALDGGTAVVGARGDDPSGAAYAFVRSGTTWIEQQKLPGPSVVPSDVLGRSVAIEGETIVVGAPASNNCAIGSSCDTGAAYVFVRSGTTWTEQARLVGSDSDVGDFFGVSVAISGDTILVGARGHDLPGSVEAERQGAAYVFVRSGTIWTEQQKLASLAPYDNEWFGLYVALDGETCAIMSREIEATVFTRSGTNWTDEARLNPPGSSLSGEFGVKVAISGNTLILGDPNDDEAAEDWGAAFVYERAGTAWSQTAKLIPSDAGFNARSGRCVSLDGDFAVLGAPAADDIGGPGEPGAAYLFQRLDSGWVERGKLVPGDPQPVSNFGNGVSIDGSTIIVGDSSHDAACTGSSSCNSGAVYAYELGDTATFVGDFCNGDGGDLMGCTPCPCGNNAAPGTISGCTHSQSVSLGGVGARLRTVGPATVPVEDLCFELEGALPNSFAILLSGPVTAPSPTGPNPCATTNPGSGIAQPAFSDGLRCIVSAGMGPVLRHGTRPIDAAGMVGVNGIGPETRWGNCSASFPNSLFVAGQTRHFQVTYREAAGQGCGAEVNSSQGVTIQFQ